MQKPAVPYEGFPLYAHATKRWAKKIRGKTHYFGPWDDPDAALKKYLDQKDDLQAGRIPRDPTAPGATTVKMLVDAFLFFKEQRIATGELTTRTFKNYHATGKTVADFLGRGTDIESLTPEDFDRLRTHLAIGRGVVALGNEVRNTRMIFHFADELSEIAVRMGKGFKEPSKKVKRQARQAAGPRTITAATIKKVLKLANPQMRSMTLLAINCGFGQGDLSALPIKALDFRKKIAVFPRPKTANDRRCPLWPETIAAVKEWLKVRPEPRDASDAGLVFITRHGHRYVRSDAEGSQQDSVALEFAKLLTDAGAKRKGINFYALRHTFETEAGDARDQVSVDFIMGHLRDDMASIYRHGINDWRLKAVTDVVHKWLFGK